MTYRGIYDRVSTAEEEHRPGGILGVRDLLIPQGVGVPVKVPLQEVGYPEFGAYEVLDDKV